MVLIAQSKFIPTIGYSSGTQRVPKSPKCLQTATVMPMALALVQRFGYKRYWEGSHQPPPPECSEKSELGGRDNKVGALNTAAREL